MDYRCYYKPVSCLRLSLFIAFLVLFTSFKSQQLTYHDFKSLLPALNQEDWKSAYKASGKLLASAENDTSEMHALVVYIHLYAGAGLVAQRQMSYKKLKKDVFCYLGQKIIMPAHPISNKDGALNQTKLECNDTLSTGFCAAANKAGSTILCFEKFDFKEKMCPDAFPARTMVRCGGKLESIELNPNQSALWVLRLRVVEAFVREVK